MIERVQICTDGECGGECYRCKCSAEKELLLEALEELTTAVHLTPDANRILRKELVRAEAAIRQARGE